MKSANIVYLRKEITTLSDYVKIFEVDLKNKYSDKSKRLYFRGEKEKYTQPCVPSLFRNKNNTYKGLSEDEIYYRTLRRQSKEFLGLSNLDILAKMQHYGISTRLLDITTNPLIALFFALEKSGTNDGSVYIFEANQGKERNVLSYDSDRALLLSTLPKLNDEHKKLISKYCDKYSEFKITPDVLSEDPKKSPIAKDFAMRKSLGKYIYECERERHAFHKNHQVNPNDLTRIYFVKSKFSNTRLEAQEGLFILFGLDKKVYDGNITGITIPHKYKKRIRAQLFFYAGLSNSKVFQSLEASSLDKKDELYSELYKDIE